jgi:hypothetical protein
MLYTVLPKYYAANANRDIEFAPLHATCFDIKIVCILPTQRICVPCDSHSKQRLLPKTALTGWAL